ncbi:MAG: hypothetical protein AB7F94_10040 [Nitrospira sp.]
MTVPAIENWTDIDGRVHALIPSTDVPGHVVVNIQVNRTKAVEGFADLLATTIGTIISVYFTQEAAQQARVVIGARIRCRIRRAGPQKIFVHPTNIRMG